MFGNYSLAAERVLALAALTGSAWMFASMSEVVAAESGPAQTQTAAPSQAHALARLGDAAYERGELAAARARWQAAAQQASADTALTAALVRRLATLDAAERALATTPTVTR
jgi:hypothetical protein